MITVREAFRSRRETGLAKYGIAVVRIERHPDSDWFYQMHPAPEYRATEAYRVWFSDGAMVMFSDRGTLEETHDQ